MKILLIEDDPVMANSLKTALKRFYVVEVANSGEEGEYKAHANEYGLFLIDYVLPDSDGLMRHGAVGGSSQNKRPALSMQCRSTGQVTVVA